MPVWSGRSPDFQKEKGVVWALAQPARPQCPALLLLELLVNRECISNCFTLGWGWGAAGTSRLTMALRWWCLVPGPKHDLNDLSGVLGTGLPGLGTEHLPGALCCRDPAVGVRNREEA